MQIVVHIGHPKTGTTSIQRFFARNRLWLARQDALYPDIPHTAPNHKGLLPLFVDPEKIPLHTINRMGYDRSVVAERAQECRTAILDVVRERAPKTLILSSESLFRAYSDREFEGLDRLLSDLGGTPRFIAYLRSPPQFFVAKLQQQLKTSSGGVGSEAIRYLEAIEAYERHYGTAPTLRVFDRTVLTDGDVVADFCATVGLDSPRDAERGPEEANASMSAEAMAVLQSAGRPTRGRTRDETRPQRELRLRVQEIDRVLPGYTRPKLRQGMRDRLVSLSSELPVLRDRYGVTFPDIDYAMIGRDMGGPFPALPVADLVPVDADRLAAFLARMEAPPRVRLKDRLRRLFGNA